MSSRLYTEIMCDGCGQADYAMHKKKGVADKQLVSTSEQMRRNGWIVGRNDKHYCTKKCKSIYLNSLKNV